MKSLESRLACRGCRQVVEWSVDALAEMIIVGVIAIVALDLWQLALKLLFGVPGGNWAQVGRWVSHFTRGRLYHRAIGEAEPFRYEAATGWIVHYGTGVIYAAIYLILMRDFLDREPGLLSSVLFGLATLAAPWLLMQPGMGLGIAARNAEAPWAVRGKNLMTHTVFGLGLYLGVLIA